MKITESPRDALQGIKKIIPTRTKIDYINTLLNVGFDIIDAGSFVSPKAIPQMADIEDVLKKIKMQNTISKILVLSGNVRYAKKAAEHEIVTYINYPFSISETFQIKNLNANFKKSINTIDKIINICIKKNKIPLISIASAFGNPYGDEWNIDILMNWIDIITAKGLRFISLADTNAMSNVDTIFRIFSRASKEFPNVEFNFHLHTKPHKMIKKISAAYDAGCRNFDTVFNGMGGCPMTGKKLIANVNTLDFVNFLDTKNIKHKLNKEKLTKANEKATDILFNSSLNCSK